MRSRFAIALCGLIVASFVALPFATAAADDLAIGEGDWWRYDSSEDMEGMVLDFEYRVKIADVKTMGSHELFVVTIDGTGDVSGNLEGTSVSGEVTMSGVEHRSTSEYSLWFREYVIGMDISAMGMSIGMDMGISMDMASSLDDYIGDDSLDMGAVVASESVATAETWTNILGMNESESETDEISMRMEVVDDSVSVDVPAGTFDCVKIEMVTNMSGSSVTSYYWYSEEVGNYVKIVGAPEDLMGIGADAELKSYSSGGGSGFVSSLMGENLWILLLVIAVVVVVIIVVLVVGRRKKATAMAPPMMQAPPPPPPPPPPT